MCKETTTMDYNEDIKMSSSLSIESDVGSLARKLNTYPTKVKKGINSGLNETGKYAVQQEKAITTKNKKTGALARSITWISNGEYSRLVNPIMVDHGKYLENGRGPVFAKRAKALHFFIKGKEVFTKSVGPAKAQPFVKPTRDALNVMYPRIMETEISKAIGKG